MTGAVWTEIVAGARAAGFDAAPLRPEAGETGFGETGPGETGPVETGPGETGSGETRDEVAAVVMLGTLGPRTWAAFQASPEAEDGAPDPLDRWSRRQAQALAKRFGGAPCLPAQASPGPPGGARGGGRGGGGGGAGGG
ncbi:MAG: hypothetical protein AAFU61_16385, partial [Pseudomonadota bacterium]